MVVGVPFNLLGVDADQAGCFAPERSDSLSAAAVLGHEQLAPLFGACAPQLRVDERIPFFRVR